MLQSERVADFMRGELAQTSEHNLLHDLFDYATVFAVRREQTLRDQKILTVTKRAERYATLNDFSGAGIVER